MRVDGAALGSIVAFGESLRNWRRARGLSQMDLALMIDASPRHLSFLETGRARPSRDMVHRLADALMAPRAGRNALLVKAGFAPHFPDTPLSEEALAPFRAILADMIARHAPNPALICNRHWTVLDANPPARLLLGALQGGAEETNLVRLLTGSPHAREVIENYAEALAELAGRLRLESLEAGVDPTFDALLAMLEAALADSTDRAPPPRRPLAPLTVRAGALGRLQFFSSIVHFGTSEDVTVRDLRLELLFPADDATRNALQAMAG